MAIRDWFQKNKQPESGKAPVKGIGLREIPRSPVTYATLEAGNRKNHQYGGFIEPEQTSIESRHRLYRYLRDHIPDVAAGVWAWVRLCSTARTLELSGGTQVQRQQAQTHLHSLEQHLLESTFDHRPGFDGLVEHFFQSVFTVGAYAGELIAQADRSGLERFIPVDPATIRFKYYPTSGRTVPCQLQKEGRVVPLQESSFFYYGLDGDPVNPYGRSPLATLPFVLRLQQQLFEDMGKAAHNAGYPTLHVKYHPPQRDPGESLASYQERIQQDFDGISQALRSRAPESNFLTQDNIEISYIGPNGQMLRWKETLETISEQVVSALHLAPFLIGRNYGTTQSWARAQYELMVNNATSIQRAAARLVEWIANLELAFHHLPVRAQCHFAPHSAWNDVDEAQAQNIRIKTLLEMRNNGLLTDDQVKQRLSQGY